MVLSAAPRRDEAARAASAAGFSALCAWAARAMETSSPAPFRRRAALILADDVGAALAASSEPEVVAARALEPAGAPAESSVFAAPPHRRERVAAAVANGMAATWAELDEGYRLAPCHAGAYIWPALVAEAEATGARVEETLRALALAYEITARLARAYPFPTMTVHPHAAFATVGAAAGVALLRRLAPDALLAAVSGAATMAFAGPYGHAIDGALARNAWTAAGAWIGFRAVGWAQAGVGGLAQSPYDVFALSFGADCVPDALDADLGRRFAVDDGYHKIFACCQYAHSMIEASLMLHQRLGAGAGARVDAIEIATHPRGLTLTAVEPPTVLSAKFSMPHAAAAAARLGTGGQAAFSRAALRDPAIAALRARVRLTPLEDVEPWPNDRAARLVWVMDDGSRHEARCRNARGGADQPFGEDVLRAKLDENAAGAPGMATALWSLLDPASDAARLADVLDVTNTAKGDKE
jgi:2-methylcitrate dehydratase PrpD